MKTPSEIFTRPNTPQKEGAVQSTLPCVKTTSEPKYVASVAVDYQKLFRNMLSGYALHELVLDDAGHPVDYIFLEVNHAFEESTGLKREDILGKRVTEVLPGIQNDPANWIETYGRVVLTGQDLHLEQYSEPLKRWYAVTAYKTGELQFSTIFQDITERKQSDQLIQTLAESAADVVDDDFLKTLVRSLCDWLEVECAIVGELQPTGKVRALAMVLDGRFIEKFEYALAGSPCENVTKVGFCKYMEKVTERFPQDEDLKNMQAESYVGTPLRGSDGNVLGVMVAISRSPMQLPQHVEAALQIIAMRVASGIQRKQEKNQQRILEMKMQQSQKLDSLGVLAGEIAHDFNNLLVGILSNADLVLERLPASEPTRGPVNEIITASRRAADLCRQMLAYSGQGKMITEEVDLHVLITEMSNLLKAAISKNAHIHIDSSTDLPAVRIDATQWRQVVMNLITNASDALGQSKGTITISTGVQHCEAELLQSAAMGDALAPGEYVTLEVSDTGCGMSSEIQRMIFDPFFTTKKNGRGLGLASTLGIIRSHQGTITVTSQPDTGTTFRVFVPSLGRPVLSIAQEIAELKHWQGEGVVLLVDDDETVRVVGRRFLERLGYSVLDAEDGNIGVELVKEHGDILSCVLLDMTMPEMDGEETLRRMHQINPHIPIVMCSGLHEQDVLNRCGELKPAGFLPKPFRVTEMITILKKVCAVSR